MGSHWFLLLLLLLGRDRAFNLPGSVLVWAVASGLRSTEGSVLDENLSCSSTSSVVLQGTKEFGSSPENKKSTSQEQVKSPQSSSETGPIEQTASTVHTAVTTVTNSMPLLDPTVTSTAKEPVGSSKTTKLTLATSAETTQPNQTLPSSTPDKVIDTNKPLPMTTTATIDTSSPTTTTLRTTVLSTATSESQERDTTAIPPTPVTSPTTGKPSDTHDNTVTQTPSQPPQTGSDVGVTELTTLSPPRSITTGMRSSVSPNPGETDMTMTTHLTTPSMAPSIASSPPKHPILSSGTGTPTVPEKLTLTPPSPTLDKVIDTNKPLPKTTSATIDTSSPTTTTLRTTVLSTATSETQERDTTAILPTPVTSPTTSKPSNTHDNTVTQTPSLPPQTGSDVGVTELTTLSPPRSITTGMRSSVSPNPVTSPTTSKPPDTQDNRVTQTPSQPPQTGCDVGVTELTTLSPPRSITTGMRSSVSPNQGETDMTMTTHLTTPSMAPSIVSSPPKHTILPSGTGTPTVPEKLTLTPPSPTPDKVIDTNKPLPTTTTATIDTSSPTTTTLRTTVLSTATSETQEKDTTVIPPTPVTSPTTSKPPDTQDNRVTQTPSQPPQTGSDVGVTELTTLSPPRSITTGMRSSVSPNQGETDMTMTTHLTTPSMAPSIASSPPKHTILPSGTGTPTVPEKLTLTPPSPTPDKVIDTNKPLPTTTTATIDTSSPTTTTLRTTVLSTATSETQERDTIAVPPTPVTSPTTSKPSDTHDNTVTQTSSQTVQINSSNGLGTTQSSHHSTGLAPKETTKSSTVIGTGKAPPNSSQSSGPGGGTCALDEYPDSTGGCACSDSYYSHFNLSREIATLQCRPQHIEVSLRSCFLKTQHWVLKQDTFEKCFRINTTEQGHRVRVFQLERKAGTCGLHISTNSSHALHSLDVHLEQALPGANSTDFRVLHFSCAYPLAANVSKPVSYLEVSIPSIHVPNTGEAVATLSIFTDPKLSAPLGNSTAAVGMPLYVLLTSNTDSDRFALVVNEIFASTNFSNTEAEATYHFVKESCPVRGRMLQDLSNGVSRFVTLAFTLSRFLNSDMLYLHAQVTLCDKQVGQPCQPACSGKNPLRRNLPWDARAGTQLEPSSGKWIVFGPLRISESRASGSRNSAGAWISIFLLIVIGWVLE